MSAKSTDAVVVHVKGYNKSRTTAEVVIKRGSKLVTRHVRKSENGVWSGYYFDGKAIIIYKLEV